MCPLVLFAGLLLRHSRIRPQCPHALGRRRSGLRSVVRLQLPALSCGHDVGPNLYVGIHTWVVFLPRPIMAIALPTTAPITKRPTPPIQNNGQFAKITASVPTVNANVMITTVVHAAGVEPWSSCWSLMTLSNHVNGAAADLTQLWDQPRHPRVPTHQVLVGSRVNIYSPRSASCVM